MAENITTIDTGSFKIWVFSTKALYQQYYSAGRIGAHDLVTIAESVQTSSDPTGSSGSSSGGSSDYVETDPVFVAHVAHSITQAMIDAWNAKGTSNLTIGTTSTTAAAGNHTHDGVYLKDETYKGTVTKVNGNSPNASGEVTITIPASITESDVSGWGFIKGYTETYQGTVKSVNSTSPDANGNVSLTIPTIGTGATNAAAGNHTHTEYESRLDSLETAQGNIDAAITNINTALSNLL